MLDRRGTPTSTKVTKYERQEEGEFSQGALGRWSFHVVKVSEATDEGERLAEKRPAVHSEYYEIHENRIVRHALNVL